MSGLVEGDTVELVVGLIALVVFNNAMVFIVDPQTFAPPAGIFAYASLFISFLSTLILLELILRGAGRTYRGVTRRLLALGVPF